jgi:hypothetical protein
MTEGSKMPLGLSSPLIVIAVYFDVAGPSGVAPPPQAAHNADAQTRPRRNARFAHEENTQMPP